MEMSETPDLQDLSISALPPTTKPEAKLDESPTPTTLKSPDKTPPHRSHDPSTNLKRSDPFKFGSRYLEADDDVFEFNAWDHVVPDADYVAYAESQYSMQRSAPVCAFNRARFNAEPAKWWDKFYTNNTRHFFKDRKWLHQEFPVLSQLTGAGGVAYQTGPVRILEVGAGAGNTAFPILAANKNPKLMLHACDFSPRAVQLIRDHEAYDPEHITAEVWDVAGVDLPPGVGEGSVDVVLLIFIFSALSPQQWDAAVRNVYRVLKPGGEVCFRDYGRGDLAQVRFRKDRYLEEGFYVRGDGTRVYFFTEDELKRIWSGEAAGGDLSAGSESLDQEANLEEEEKKERKSPVVTTTTTTPATFPKFDIRSLGVDRRMLVNRQRQLKMYRCWMQGHFRKPTDSGGTAKPEEDQ